MGDIKFIRWDMANGERGPLFLDAHIGSGYCGLSVGDMPPDGYRATMIVQRGTLYEATLEK